MRPSSFACLSLLGLSCFAFATPAAAHISLEQGGTHLSRYGDTQTDLKDAPCGHANGPRGAHVYTYASGSTITVSIVEAIPHPSYFRIAFDDDGDDAFIDPASIKPIDPARQCPDGPGDHCGASDFFNAPAVLMDNLNPHIPAATDFLSPPKYTWEVKLPDVSCTNCTLQIIQVMEDDAFHGPYDPTPGVGVADIYHQCIDLVLTGAPPATGSGGAGAGGAASAGGATGAGGVIGVGGEPAAGGATGAGGVGAPGGSTSAAGGGAPVGAAGGGPGAGGVVGVGGVGAAAGAGAGTGGGGGASDSQGTASTDQSGGCSVVRSPRSGSTAAWASMALAFGALGLQRRRSRRVQRLSTSS